MHKASPVELRTSIEMAHSLAQIGVRFVPIPVETDEEFHTLAASLSQKLEMMVAKAEADERDPVLPVRLILKSKKPDSSFRIKTSMTFAVAY